MIVIDKFFEEVFVMSNNDFGGGGWYPHDGEGKGMCTGPGCDCDERNYGYHSSSGDNPSGFWVLLSYFLGLVCEAGILVLLGVDAENVPAFLFVVLWALLSSFIVVIGGEHGL
jgi:hypothetical protein